MPMVWRRIWGETKVLLQVNIGAALSKGGFELDEIREHFEEISSSSISR